MAELRLDQKQIDELRPLIEKTKKGSAARRLLAMIDEAFADCKARDRREILEKLRHQKRTPEEAEKMVAAWEAGAKIDIEQVRCWECEGWGWIRTPGCMGAGSDTCPVCHGNQRAWRYKMPE